MTESHFTWSQLLVTVSAGFAAASIGANVAFPARVIPSLQDDTDPDLKTPLKILSFYAGINILSSLFMLPLGGFLSTMYGRRRCFLAFSVPATLGWILTATAWNRPVLFAGRFLSCVSANGFSASIGAYISEMVHPQVRGSLGVFQSMFLSLGMLIVYGAGYFLTWRQTAWACSVPSIMLFCMMLFLPETVYWRVNANQYDEALKSLTFVRKQNASTSEEFQEIISAHEKRQLDRKDSTDWRWIAHRLASSSFRRPYVRILAICLLKAWSGISILNNYMVLVFKDSQSSIDPDLAPVIVGCVRVVAAAISSVIMRKINRRYLYLICVLTVGLGNGCIATFALLKSGNNSEDSFLNYLGWIPLVCVMLMYLSFSMGVLPVIHLLLGEVFPSDIRSVAIGLTQSSTHVFSLINVVIYPYMLDWLDFPGVFFLFAIITLISASWSFYIMPDNRGLSLVKTETSMMNSVTLANFGKVPDKT